MNHLNTPACAVRPLRIALLATLALLLGTGAAGVMAQTYKVVGPDGKVTYTDRPPAAADIKAPPRDAAAAAASSGNLPYETRQAMGKYPVTLYATKVCPFCDEARRSLRARGVPFNEVSVSTESDFAAFQSRFKGNTFPVIVIGSKTMTGYSAADLSGYLDAAGYPAQARLTGYSWPAATPMTTPGAATTSNTAGADGPAPAPSPQAPLLPPPSTSGIRF